MKDYYKILGIPENATQAEVKKAYYRLAHKLHPDKNPDPALHRQFVEINEAYETLGNKQKRQLYHYRLVNFRTKPVSPSPVPQPRPAAANRRRYAPPKFGFRQPHDYKEYEPALRKICKLCLVFGLILTLDRLFAYERKQETVLQFSGTEIRNKSTSEWQYELFTTNTHFSVSQTVAKALLVETGQHISVWQTPLLRQELKIRFLEQDFKVNGGSIYHNFFFLVLAQLIFGAAGLYRRFAWPTRMNASILAGVSGVLTVLVLFLTM